MNAEDSMLGLIAMTPIQINNAFLEWGLIWLGFGALLGFAAKALTPGPEPGGSLATVLFSIFGTFLGCGVLWFFLQSIEKVRPLTTQGLVCGVIGAFLMVMFYRLMGGYYFEEGDQIGVRARRRRRRRRNFIE